MGFLFLRVKFLVIGSGKRKISCMALQKYIFNLSKLGDGIDESPFVMVGDKQKKLGENRGILKPSWAFVKTNDNHSYFS